jgi:hypothetical protein
VYGSLIDPDGYLSVSDQLGNLGSYHSHSAKVGNPPTTYLYLVNMAFLIRDTSTSIEKPHIGGTVVDVAQAGEGDVLRSEVAAAVGLLRHQVRRGDFSKHHTLPVSIDLYLSMPLIPSDRGVQVIVFSFQHDRFGRVTQFHFDGRSLVMRQSRLLDFRADEPTTDAYHMMRWMANQPMGETKLRQV